MNLQIDQYKSYFICIDMVLHIDVQKYKLLFLKTWLEMKNIHTAVIFVYFQACADG